ncbi:MAG TPA: YebC/PmpR family DNA-binding transcriptional regulator [Caulobacteraceae bacterium]|jgi:YebC/PmpR family DNA-binding regulatory protein|nr:YebC/PmpR family DNA-binding transcriptional regulator [Caulobacteraceae bacterium]
MAGHSKFKNIQFRKGAQDKKRSKIFSKLSRDITLAAKQGLPDPSANARLRLAIVAARAESMPKENIDRAIKKAIGGETDNFEDIRYEGFGPGGVGVIVEVLTDNRNRAAASVRTHFGKNGGNMGESGSVAFMFDRVGEIVYPPAAGSEDAVMEAAIEAGAEDVQSDEDGHLITTRFEDLSAVVEALEGSLGQPTSTGVVWRPKTEVPVSSAEAATLMKLIDALDDDDDVQNVFVNAEFSDEDLARHAG